MEISYAGKYQNCLEDQPPEILGMIFDYLTIKDIFRFCNMIANKPLRRKILSSVSRLVWDVNQSLPLQELENLRHITFSTSSDYRLREILHVDYLPPTLTDVRLIELVPSRHAIPNPPPHLYRNLHKIVRLTLLDDGSFSSFQLLPSGIEHLKLINFSNNYPSFLESDPSINLPNLKTLDIESCMVRFSLKDLTRLPRGLTALMVRWIDNPDPEVFQRFQVSSSALAEFHDRWPPSLTFFRYNAEYQYGFSNSVLLPPTLKIAHFIGLQPTHHSCFDLVFPIQCKETSFEGVVGQVPPTIEKLKLRNVDVTPDLCSTLLPSALKELQLYFPGHTPGIIERYHELNVPLSNYGRLKKVVFDRAIALPCCFDGISQLKSLEYLKFTYSAHHPLDLETFLTLPSLKVFKAKRYPDHPLCQRIEDAWPFKQALLSEDPLAFTTKRLKNLRKIQILGFTAEFPTVSIIPKHLEQFSLKDITAPSPKSNQPLPSFDSNQTIDFGLQRTLFDKIPVHGVSQWGFHLMEIKPTSKNDNQYVEKYFPKHSEGSVYGISVSQTNSNHTRYKTPTEVKKQLGGSENDRVVFLDWNVHPSNLVSVALLPSPQSSSQVKGLLFMKGVSELKKTLMLASINCFSNLTTLCIMSATNEIIFDSLPRTLTSFAFDASKCRHLRKYHRFGYLHLHHIVKLPPSLTQLSFKKTQLAGKSLLYLPKGLEYLSVSSIILSPNELNKHLKTIVHTMTKFGSEKLDEAVKFIAAIHPKLDASLIRDIQTDINILDLTLITASKMVPKQCKVEYSRDWRKQRPESVALRRYNCSSSPVTFICNSNTLTFPESLTKLDFSNSQIQKVSQLTRNLPNLTWLDVRFRVRSGCEKMDHFPPKLTHLTTRFHLWDMTTLNSLKDSGIQLTSFYMLQESRSLRSDMISSLPSSLTDFRTDKSITDIGGVMSCFTNLCKMMKILHLSNTKSWYSSVKLPCPPNLKEFMIGALNFHILKIILSGIPARVPLVLSRDQDGRELRVLRDLENPANETVLPD